MQIAHSFKFIYLKKKDMPVQSASTPHTIQKHAVMACSQCIMQFYTKINFKRYIPRFNRGTRFEIKAIGFSK